MSNIATYFTDGMPKHADRAYAYYGPYRKQVRHVGQKRAYVAAKADHCTDHSLPVMKPLDYVQRDGSWADQERALKQINRWSSSRQRWLLLERKERRMKARQLDRHLRQRLREWG